MLKDVRMGGSSAVGIVGEAGIGKTSLLAELQRRSDGSGSGVVRGVGSELEPDVPFGLFVAALDDVLGELDPVTLKRLGQDRLVELSAVFPSLGSEGERLAGALEVERYRSHYAVRSLLQMLARERPLVLVLDDIHWADTASAELIAHLLRQPVAGMLLALALRPRAPRLLTRAIDRAVREQRLRKVELGPLSREEASQLLSGMVLPPALDDLYLQSGGNPFLLEQMARSSARHQALLPGGTQPTESDAVVPAAVVAMTVQELDGLSEPAQLLAKAAAVVGDPFDLSLAAEVADVDEAACLPAVDELVAADLVRPAGAFGRLSFRHPVIRRALYDVSGYGWRVGAHRRAGLAVARRGAPLGVQAHHVALSAPPVGDRDAMELLLRASRTVGPRAPAAAAQWLQAAERLLPTDAAGEERLHLQLDLGARLATIGRFHEARSVLLEALEQLPTADTQGMCRLSLQLSRIVQQLGNREESLLLLTKALGSCSPDSQETALLTLELAKNHAMVRAWDDAAHAAHDAAALAQTLADPELIAASASACAIFDFFKLGAVDGRGDAKIGDDVQQRVAEMAATLDDVSDEAMTPLLLESLDLLVRAEVATEQWVASERHSRRGVRVCRSTGQGARYLDFMAMLAATLMYQGRLAEAREVADVVAEALELVDGDQLLIQNESLRCRVAWLQGQTEVALDIGRRAVHAAERAPEAFVAGLAPICYGEALVEAGRHEEGRAAILSAGGPGLSDVAPIVRCYWYRVLTHCALELGRVDEAQAMAARARRLADLLALPMRIGDACQAEAAVLLAQGDAGSAIERASDSVDAYERSGLPIDAARSQVLAGRVLVQLGDRAGAVARLEAAHATFERCGAVRLADNAARELRRLGKRIARKAGGSERGADRELGLSPREREVADLVAKGHTTRQMADQLYVSPKTIETHLAHIYRKLGVSSRAAMIVALNGVGEPT